MYLKNVKTKKPSPFVYRFGYQAADRSIQFQINPICIPIIQDMNPANLILPHCYEKVGLKQFEPNIEKNFGFGNCSVNKGIVDGLLTISFPVKTTYTLSEKDCDVCHGKKKYWNDHPCYACRGSGKEFIDRSNIDNICGSLNVLTRYLNWWGIMSEAILPDNEWGLQDIFIELDDRAGIGGEGSDDFFERIITFADETEHERVKNMFDLYTYIDGKEQFPNFEIYVRDHEFRCEIDDKGRLYVQVPGQNGCSIHMTHNSNRDFACHNVDTPQQHLCLVAGFAMIVGQYYNA